MNRFPPPREPINAWTHWAGALLGLLALGPLLLWAQAQGLALWPFGVFGASLVLLYTASASYHSFSPGEAGAVWLRKLDHANIFLLIAGTYTPVLYFSLPQTHRAGALLLIWGLALLGIGYKLLTLRGPRVVSTLLYVALGWLAVAFWPQLRAGLPPAALAWLVVGGVLYSAGAVVYALKRPRRSYRGWGFHEVWHLFVLGGSAAHLTMMFSLR